MADDRWISMDEATPGKTGSYIVATSNGAVCTAKWYAHPWKPHFNGSAKNYITHWMPFPKHPRKGKADD